LTVYWGGIPATRLISQPLRNPKRKSGRAVIERRLEHLVIFQDSTLLRWPLRGFVIVVIGAAVVLTPVGWQLDAAEPTGELVGTVVDLEGRSVPKAKVWLETRSVSGKTIATVETGFHGRFRIGPIAPECRARLLVEASGFGRELREGVSIFPNAVNEVQVLVAPGRTVRGRVLGTDGQPAAHVPVRFQFGRVVTGRVVYEPVGPESRVTADSRGEFSVPDVPPCAFFMAVRMPESAIAWLREDIQPGSGPHSLRTLRMSRDVPIAGIVHDSTGKPLANIEVDTSFELTAKTDASGRFVLRGCPADQIPSVRLEISAPGFAREVVPVGGNRAPLDVVLKRQRWISGRVVDAETGAPVAIKRLILCTFARRPNGEIARLNCRPVHFEQPEKGQFRVAYERLQGYHVTVMAEGFDDAEAFVEPLKKYEDVSGIFIKARRNGSKAPADTVPVPRITGTLTRSGRPVTSAWVSLWELRTERQLPDAWIQRGRTVAAQAWLPRSEVPSSAGVYSLDAPDQGRWYVTVEEPNRAPTLQGPFDIELNQKLHLDIGLSPGGSISGRVREIPTDSVGYWWVVVFDRTVWRAECRVEKDGTFRLDDLPAGEYGLKVGHDGFHDADVPDRPSAADLKRQTHPWQAATVVQVKPGQTVTDVMLAAPSVTPVTQTALPSNARSNK
jgi:hypothetical protein